MVDISKEELQKLHQETVKTLRLVKLASSDTDSMDSQSTQSNHSKELIEKIIRTVEYVDFLKQINTENVKPTYSPSMYWDQDWIFLPEDDQPISTNVDEILQNAPKSMLNYFVVPKVIDHE